MEYKKRISIFVVLFGVVCSSDCGEDLDKLFDDNATYCGFDEPWAFSETSENSNDVTKYMSPNTRTSCITSHLVPIADGDVIQVNVYAKSIGEQDYVTATVYEAAEEKVVGKVTLSNEDNSVENGLHVLEITLNGLGDFNGHITLTGAASENSVLLVKSVCITSTVEEDTTHKENIVKLTSNQKSPDVYGLQAEVVLKENIHPDVNIVEHRAMRFIDFEDFWTPLTITLSVVIPVIILILLGWGCYALGRRNGSKQEPDIIYEDVNNIPKPHLVPRVKSVYTDSVTGSSYGRNNIYSV